MTKEKQSIIKDGTIPFYLVKKESTDGLVEKHYIKEINTDSQLVNYVVTDYYNSSRTAIIDTTIEKIGQYIHEEQIPAEVDEYVEVDSHLGKKILEFLNDGGVSYEEAHPTKIPLSEWANDKNQL